jgi:hypothetical protein
MHYDTELRDARLNAIAALIGAGAKMRLFSGPAPNTTASADPSGVLVEIDLPSQPFLPAAGGRLVSGHQPWHGYGVRQRTGKNDGAVACSFRVYDYLGNCRIQGDVGTEAWADLILSDCLVHAGQPIVINDFVLVEPE